MSIFMKIILIFFGLCYCIGSVYVLTGFFLRLITIIKCIGIHKCKKDDCRLRPYCRRTVLSDKELADLRAYSAKLK